MFAAAGALQQALVSTVATAPASLAPLEAVAAGLEAVAAELPDRETARARQTIIAANPQLRERELTTFAALSAALAEALRARGLPDPAGTFERWIDDTNDRDLPELIRETLEELQALSAQAPRLEPYQA
jgi:hypothetical protein